MHIYEVWEGRRTLKVTDESAMVTVVPEGTTTGAFPIRLSPATTDTTTDRETDGVAVVRPRTTRCPKNADMTIRKISKEVRFCLRWHLIYAISPQIGCPTVLNG